MAQRKAVARVMHHYVDRHPQYALTGGHGRKPLVMFEPADPESCKAAGVAHPEAAG